MKRIFVAISAMLLCGAAVPVDWKVFSFATDDGHGVLSFYDASSIKRGTDGHLIVWVKSMDASLLLAVKTSPEGLARIDAKVRSGYIPPVIALIPSTPSRGAVISEEQANNAGVAAASQVLWEIDCDKSVNRILSATETVKGVQSSFDAVGDWQHVPPGSVGDNLIRLLCQ